MLKRVVIPIAVVLSLVAGVGIWRVSTPSGSPPPFSKGGTFAAGTPADAAEPIAGTRGKKRANGGAATKPERVKPSGAADERDPASAGAGPDQTATTDSASHVPRKQRRPARSAPARQDPVSRPRTAAAPAKAGNDDRTLPALGSYTYAVNGWEAATGFGRRGYPGTMEVTIHRSQDVPASDVVMDLRFSDDHEEREIVRADRTGLAFVFEGGSVTFGPGTQTSEATYDPAIVQIPFPLRAGTAVEGTSEAVDRNGNTVRTEDWTVKVVGETVISVLGKRVRTWVVDSARQTRPGGAEQLTRTRRYWYDPQRALWVQWHESFTGRRAMAGVTFTYETEYTATLQGFAPR